MKQLNLLKNEKSAYGGELLKTRKGRSRPRPLSTRETLHLVLRSTKAKGEWSFTKHRRTIHEILARFSRRYGVKVLSYANVGNHLHFHVKLSNRYLYAPFIRALTGAIAMAVTGTSRWKPLKVEAKDRFWDYRPFTRVVKSFRAFLNLKDYIKINQLEGYGYAKTHARFFVAGDAASQPHYDTS